MIVQCNYQRNLCIIKSATPATLIRANLSILHHTDSHNSFKMHSSLILAQFGPVPPSQCIFVYSKASIAHKKKQGGVVLPTGTCFFLPSIFVTLLLACCPKHPVWKLPQASPTTMTNRGSSPKVEHNVGLSSS